jgi:hypothetical protein
MGFKLLKNRVVRPWGVWVVTLVLLVLALVSFVIHPSVTLQVGIRSGITHSIVIEEGSLIYERYRHEMILNDASSEFAESYFSRLDQKRWDLNWRSGWREFELNGIGPIRNPVWWWFFPSRPFASSFTVPLVLPLMLFGVLSSYSVLEERRRRRVFAGLCGGCGYSLAGLDGGVCPECGEGTDVAS